MKNIFLTGIFTLICAMANAQIMIVEQIDNSTTEFNVADIQCVYFRYNDDDSSSNQEKELIVENSGTLSTLISEIDMYNITKLKLKGVINGSDIKIIRMMAGADEKGLSTGGKLAKLDLSNVKIVAGGDAYYSEREVCTTTYDVIGCHMFYKCTELKEIILPQNIRYIGYNAFADCSNLENLYIPVITPPFCLYLGSDISTNIYVPEISLNKYQNEACWQRYKSLLIGMPGFEQNEEYNNNSDTLVWTDISLYKQMEEIEELSDFVYIINRCGEVEGLNTSRSATVFAPRNAAIRAYINRLYNDESSAIPHHGLKENSIYGLTDSICKKFFSQHILPNAYTTSLLKSSWNKQFDVLSDMKEDNGFVHYSSESVKVSFYQRNDGSYVLNNRAAIIWADIICKNGYLDIIDDTIFEE